MSHIKGFQHLKIPLEAIISATNNFSAENCIGKGGFGKVYKGEIVHSKGRSMVAFKRLDRAFGQGDPEFWKEIMMLSLYTHENIVSLLGFCDESDEKILVYEYASKGSLDMYLEKDDLSWIQRLKICIGAARGLAYLHNPVGTHLRVLHRDIKSSNILIDENWHAKISDFGLSKLGPVNHQFTFFISNAVGTIGYCDPLYIENGFLTKESDVYSFGVVLFEVLCGRLCFSNKNDKYQPLPKLARESYEENKISEIIHGNLKDEIHHRSLKYFTRIAYQCLKRDREERPLMIDIVRILETALEYQINYRQPVENAATVSSGSTEGHELHAETARIKAEQQKWLGCSPSESLSLRYWSNNVINYDEKVMDGFYDVYGITSNSVTQAKMPSLVDLQATIVYDNVDNEVVLVDRTIDKELQLLEERVSDISLECRASGTSQVISMMIANIVVAQMGGPVSDADEMLRRWTTRSYELRNTLKTIILPLGCIDCGLSRHRALLFKVLADKINLACCLVKGSNYTGTDDGTVNLIKINGSEYIIDLMGAPGTLIPVEACNLQSIELDIRSDAAGSDSFGYTLPLLDISSDPIFDTPVLDGFAKASTSELTVTPIIGLQLNSGGGNAVERNQTERFKSDFGKLLPDFGKLLPAFGRSDEGLSGGGGRTSPAQKLQLNDVSKYVINAVKNLKFAQKLHAVSLKSGGSGTSPDSLLDVNNDEVGETEVCKAVHLLDADMLNVGAQHQHGPALVMSNYEQDLISFTAAEVSNLNDNSQLVDNWLPAKPKQLVSSKNNLGYTVPSQYTTAGFLEGLMNDHAVANSMERQSGDGVAGGEPCLINKARAGNTRNGKNLDTKLVETSRIGLDEVRWEIPWEDLQIGGRIGIGSYGEVYRSEWNGTEVALKKLINQDISEDVLTQFRGEVEMMLRLRHPNVVLFMGAVTRPPNLSILTEFLPRGSLFKLLHQSNVQLDEKRRLHMALDVAKGMNYLHTSNPIIVHRNLKTPNLLVDKNWVVKVCDFGMSRMKHNTFLSSKSTAGTPEWMAPEVLRNEPSNEKCDVYSFGVILWELATLHIPWAGMNSMQVVGAVGFQLRRLDIPEHLDPLVTRIISDCWHPEPHLRPSFKEIIARLKSLGHLSMEGTKTRTSE